MPINVPIEYGLTKAPPQQDGTAGVDELTENVFHPQTVPGDTTQTRRPPNKSDRSATLVEQK